MRSLPRKRELAALLLYYSGVVLAVGMLRRALGVGGPVFLTGHRVVPAEAALADPVDRMALLSRHAITPAELAQRLAFLQRWLMPAGDPAELRSGLPHRRAFYLTFDDGYVDNVTHAAPVLERLGVHAVIFLVADLVANPGASPWWDRWGAEVLQRRGSQEDAVREYNRRCGEAKRTFVGLTGADLADCGRRRYLTQAEVDALPASLSPANHTGSHANLSVLGPAEIAEQVNAGEAPIAGHPRRLPLLSFPFGSHDDRLTTWLRETGRYRMAFATGAGARSDALRVRRINLNVAGFPLFAAQCAGILD